MPGRVTCWIHHRVAVKNTNPNSQPSRKLAKRRPESPGQCALPAAADHTASNSGTRATKTSGHQFNGGKAAANNKALPDAAARDLHGVKVMSRQRGGVEWQKRRKGTVPETTSGCPYFRYSARRAATSAWMNFHSSVRPAAVSCFDLGQVRSVQLLPFGRAGAARRSKS